MCKIKAKKKTRQRRTLERRQLTATVERDNVIYLRPLQEYPDGLVLGKFMEIKWKGNDDEDKEIRCRKGSVVY